MQKKRVYILGPKKVDIDTSISQKQVIFLKEIKSNNSISKIALKHKISRTAVYKTVNRLIKKGLIKRLENGVYTLTEKSVNLLKKVYTSTPDEIRSNNVRFEVKILKKSKNWDQRRVGILLKKNYPYKPNKRNSTFSYTYNQIRIVLGRDNINFIMPSLIENTPFEAFEQNLQMLLDTIPIIENDFKILLIKDRYCNMKIVTQEYALIDNELAKKYAKEGNNLFLYNENNELWLIIDHSFEHELEAVHPKTAVPDATTVHRFLNDLRRNPATISDINNAIMANVKIQKTSMEMQEVYNQNIVKHLNVLDTMKETLIKIQQNIRSIKK